MRDHATPIVRLLHHQDYLQITLLAPPAVILSVIYRSHKEVTVNVDQLTAQKVHSHNTHSHNSNIITHFI